MLENVHFFKVIHLPMIPASQQEVLKNEGVGLPEILF